MEHADHAEAPRAEVLIPDAEPIGEARIIATGVPPPSEQGGAEFDYPDAALKVLDLYAAVLSEWHGETADPDAASRTVPDSQAREHVEELVEAARDASTRPEGTFVLRGFEVGGFGPDLLQVDFCLDQSETTVHGGDGGEVADLAEAAAGEAGSAMLWTGVGMQRAEGRDWQAFRITHREVGDDPEHPCMES